MYASVLPIEHHLRQPYRRWGGRIIGIDTAASRCSAVATGYAIPSAAAVGIVSQIESGVQTDQITIGRPRFFDVAVRQSTGTTTGATITTANGTPIASGSQLSTLIGSHEPGDSVTIGWTDAASAARTATATLIEGAAD